MTTEMICIVCPKGCRMQVTESEGTYTVTGQSCPRGEEYGKIELLSPTRTITSTVRINGALHRRCPVKTTLPIPKEQIYPAMELLDSICVQAPVYAGQVVFHNLLGGQADFVISRDMKNMESGECHG